MMKCEYQFPKIGSNKMLSGGGFFKNFLEAVTGCCLRNK